MEEKIIHKTPEGIRIVTDDDIKQYDKMITKWLRDSVVKNWNEANLNKSESEVSLGNSGFTMADMRQHLYTELVIALQKYNPDYRTKDGRSVKESTFVYQHLYNRIGQLMKKLTKHKSGYGIWGMNLEDVLKENTDFGD